MFRAMSKDTCPYRQLALNTWSQVSRNPFSSQVSALRPQSQTCQQPYSYTLFKVLVTNPQCLVGLQLNKAA